MNLHPNVDSWPGAVFLAWALIFAGGLAVQAGWRKVSSRLRSLRTKR